MSEPSLPDAPPEHEATVEPAAPAGSRAPRPGVFGVVMLPGVALARRQPVTAALLVVAGIIAPAFALALLVEFRNDVAGLVARTGVLRGLVIVAIVSIISRVLAVWLTARQISAPDHRRRMQCWGTAAAAVIAVPVGFAALRIEQVRGVVDDVFASSPDAGRVSAGSADPLSDDFATVLLLGGDEGRDRFGLRTDTMVLAMMHRASGHTALISIPRNLEDLQFPPGSPMAERYPNGFDDLTNAVYITVETDEELSAAYGGEARAGAQALMEGISYSMGVTIDDYALINMCGFVQIVDAIGGVIIDIEEELPMPGRVECSNYRLDPTIGPGSTFMDGTKALGYVRSRVGDSDYQRMERQRILLETISREAGVQDVLFNFGSLASATRDNITTSMTVAEVQTLVSALQGSDVPIVSVGLNPPLVEPSAPDYDAIKATLQDQRTSLGT
jgi:polyisoprenyl-teichoic acid--peptidoglycan teichoic acid transferase